MALEDLTGTNAGLEDLVVTNPDGLDPKSQGDNHIRGVKNVLVNTFGPMEAAAVALPAADEVLTWDGAKYAPKAIPIPPSGAPTRQVFLSGSGSYTTPAGAAAINVRMVGGGGGSPDGINSTFGTLIANGGQGTGGIGETEGGDGGTATGGDINIKGGGGSHPGRCQGVVVNLGGMAGGASVFGGGGFGGRGFTTPTNGGPGAPNSGGGGGSNGIVGATNTSGYPSAGAGGYCEKLFSGPAASYAYAVGAGGAAGGGVQAGGSGIIIVDEFY
jgi:hypothetical protein